MDKLEEGDIFYIKVLDETLSYQIDQILTVLPEETDALAMLNLGGYDGSAYLFMLDDDGNITYTNQKDDIFFEIIHY